MTGAARIARGHFGDVLRSELCKLGTVRSTSWTLLAAVVFNLGLAALLALVLPGQLSAQDKATVDTVRVSLGGIHLSQIAFGVLGVLAVSAEYTTGTISATLSAVPQRRLVLAAKALAFAAPALVVGTLSSFAAFFLFQALVTDAQLQSSIDSGVLRAVTGGGVYLTMLGLLGLGLGAVLRSSAGGITALSGLLFVPPLLLALLPRSWQTTLGPYAPMEAGAQIYAAGHQGANALEPWAGFGVFGAYAVVALAAGFISIARRDA